MSLSVVYTGTRQPEPPPGVRVLHLPMLAIEPREVDESAVRSYAQPGTNLVFYSSNGVDSVARQTRLLDEAPSGVRFWAVGSKTAEALQILGHGNVSVPADEAFDGLVEELPAGRHVSFELEGGIRSLADARPNDSVLTVVCYASVPQVDDERPIWRQSAPDWIVFTSPRGFDSFLAHTAADAWLRASRTAAIGPTTAESMTARGHQPTFVPDEPDGEKLLQSLASIDESDP